jgi:hypothetical protein
VVAILLSAIGVAWLLAPDAPAERQRALPAPTQVGPILQTPIAPPRASPVVRPGQAAPPARYEWVDPERGIVRVPIDAAMEVVVSSGTPR